MTIKPHFLPKKFSDAAIIAIVFPLQALGLFILPGTLAYFAAFLALDGRISAPFLVLVSTMSGLITPVIVYAVFLMFTVWSIKVSETGISFIRLLGFPRALTWNSITDISPASSSEVILKGWLWPLLPAREMTPTLSSLGHFRISWHGGYCYYPPADAELFTAEIRKYYETKKG